MLRTTGVFQILAPFPTGRFFILAFSPDGWVMPTDRPTSHRGLASVMQQHLSSSSRHVRSWKPGRQIWTPALHSVLHSWLQMLPTKCYTEPTMILLISPFVRFLPFSGELMQIYTQHKELGGVLTVVSWAHSKRHGGPGWPGGGGSAVRWANSHSRNIFLTTVWRTDEGGKLVAMRPG